jgi:two-component sensor histidine kinase
VIVNWSVEGAGEEARFKFEWREVGGPPVGPPQRRGFGTALLNMAISSAPDSPSPVRFEPQGLVYSIDVPLASIT